MVTPTVFDRLRNLAGRHRIQRVPPNERKGRRHSSEVTVVVLAPSEDVQVDLDDVQIELSRGSGPGGQHRNKTESMVKAIHVPTGVTAVADGRSQYQNRQRVLDVLSARLQERSRELAHVERNGSRRDQVQGGRVMTWTDWRDQVVVHASGRKVSMTATLRGDLDKLI
jgi:peptide chain release factor 1